MPNYTYPTNQITFGARDALSTADVNKRISGAQLDLEFNALKDVSALKLNVNNPSFTGTMTGDGTIDGGTFL